MMLSQMLLHSKTVGDHYKKYKSYSYSFFYWFYICFEIKIETKNRLGLLLLLSKKMFQ